MDISNLTEKYINIVKQSAVFDHLLEYNLSVKGDLVFEKQSNFAKLSILKKLFRKG